MATSTAAIIGCGTDRVTFGLFRRGGAAPVLEDFAAVRLAGRPAHGENWPARLAAALVELRGRVEDTGPVTVLVPGHMLLAKHVRTPRLPAAKCAKVLRFEAAQAIPFRLEEVGWTHVVSGEGESHRNHLLLAARSEPLAELFSAVTVAGFELGRALPEPLAVHAAVRAAESACERPRLAVHLGGGATTMLLEEPSGFFVRLVVVANAALVQPDTETASAVAVEGHALRLAREAERTVLAFERQGAQGSPASVLLLGEAAAAAGFVEALAGRLRLPVRPIACRGSSAAEAGKVAGEAAAGGHFPEELSGAAAIEFGLAGQGADLLPPRLRRQMGGPERRCTLAVAALAVLAALVPPLVHFHRVAAEARLQGEAIRQVLAPWQARESEMSRDLRRLADLRQRQRCLERIQERRGHWLTLLADLELRLAGVEGAWIERLSLQPTPVGPLRLGVSGWLQDPVDDQGAAAGSLPARAGALLAALAASPRLAGIEQERFLRGDSGALGFELVLVPAAADSR